MSANSGGKKAQAKSPAHFCHAQCSFLGLQADIESMTQTLGVSLLACCLLGILSFQNKRLVKLYEITIDSKISHVLCSRELERNLRISSLVIQSCIPVFCKAEVVLVKCGKAVLTLESMISVGRATMRPRVFPIPKLLFISPAMGSFFLCFNLLNSLRLLSGFLQASWRLPGFQDQSLLHN